MPNIRLVGELSISKDLFSRLHSRGLLDISGEPTEDMFCYISECLARDTIGMQAVAFNPVDCKHSTTTESIQSDAQLSEQPEDSQVTSQLNEIPVAKDDLASRINKLYGR